jgi:hypothetical protein
MSGKREYRRRKAILAKRSSWRELRRSGGGKRLKICQFGRLCGTDKLLK